MEASVPMLSELVLIVPGLVERSAVGTSCCVTSADALVTQELWMLSGVADTHVEAATGRVLVRYDAASVTAAEILSALDDIGYPATPG